MTLEARRNARFSRNGNDELPRMATGSSGFFLGKPEEGPRLENESQRPSENPSSNADGRSKRTSKAASTRPKNIMVAGNDKKKAMEVGLEAMIGPNKLTRELYPHGKPHSETFHDSVKKPRYKKSGSRQTLNDNDLKMLISLEDVIATAQSSASLPAMHVSQYKNQAKALTDIVASIPAENKKEARDDKKTVEDATKAFVLKPRLVDGGRWKLRGLKTTLMYHQVSFVLHL